MTGKTFSLAIQAEPDTSYSGWCRLDTGSGEETIMLDGVGPMTRELRGAGLSCNISQTSGSGRLVIEVKSGTGNVSRSSTQGRGSTVRLSVR